MEGIHWLKINNRITYKVSVIMHSIHNKIIPHYQRDLIPSKPNSKQLICQYLITYHPLPAKLVQLTMDLYHQWIHEHGTIYHKKLDQNVTVNNSKKKLKTSIQHIISK